LSERPFLSGVGISAPVRAGKRGGAAAARHRQTIAAGGGAGAVQGHSAWRNGRAGEGRQARAERRQWRRRRRGREGPAWCTRGGGEGTGGITSEERG